MSTSRRGSWRDPFGSCAPVLWWHGWRDRRGGRLARAAARWGRLRHPGEAGQLLWLLADDDADSVRLAVELARALREKCPEWRLVLTYEEEFPELLAGLEGLAGVGHGWAPSDHPRALDSVWARLRPDALIFCGGAPRPHLGARIAGIAHVLGVATPSFPCERGYPLPGGAGQQTLAEGRQAMPSDLLTLTTVAQVEPNFRSMALGGRDAELWWLHADDEAPLDGWLPQFARAMPHDVLFLSGRAAQKLPPGLPRLSEWERRPFAPGAAVIADAPRWLPALAASCRGAHLRRPSRSALWQALAGGTAPSFSPAPALLGANAGDFPLCPDTPEVLAEWQRLRGQPIAARTLADAARRVFWQARRGAGEVAGELLERVASWH